MRCLKLIQRYLGGGEVGLYARGLAEFSNRVLERV